MATKQIPISARKLEKRERHYLPWVFEYQGKYYDWLCRLVCRWFCFKSKTNKPDFIDRFGCPYWITFVQKENNLQWYIQSQTKRVGDIGVSWIDKKVMRIGDIEIHHPRDRGRGLGTVLLKRVISFAKENNQVQKIVGKITSNDIQANPNLVIWYERHGFQFVANELDMPGFYGEIEMVAQSFDPHYTSCSQDSN
jgi:GNAT superfamily N-acetyltransferase